MDAVGAGGVPLGSEDGGETDFVFLGDEALRLIFLDVPDEDVDVERVAEGEPVVSVIILLWSLAPRSAFETYFSTATCAPHVLIALWLKSVIKEPFG